MYYLPCLAQFFFNLTLQENQLRRSLIFSCLWRLNSPSALSHLTSTNTPPASAQERYDVLQQYPLFPFPTTASSSSSLATTPSGGSTQEPFIHLSLSGESQRSLELQTSVHPSLFLPPFILLEEVFSSPKYDTQRLYWHVLEFLHWHQVCTQLFYFCEFSHEPIPSVSDFFVYLL